MGTRSLTFVYDGDVPVINIYRQYDGYPSGHGHELAQFLDSKTLVNGYGEQNSFEANGMGCLAAQLIVQLKHGVGGIYIYPAVPAAPEGRLRLLYECNPLAFIAEQSGGLATTGRERIMEIQPTTLHQRVPYYIGSKSMVEKAMSFLT